MVDELGGYQTVLAAVRRSLRDEAFHLEHFPKAASPFDRVMALVSGPLALGAQVRVALDMLGVGAPYGASTVKMAPLRVQ